MLFMMLAACFGKSKETELHDYVNQVLARPGGKIEPLPDFQPFTPYQFASSELRSPFMLPKKVSSTFTPDMNRPKEELEAYALDTLKMVGTLGAGPVAWALIEAPNGTIYKVKVGNYMGRNFGKVKEITKNSLLVKEVVPDESGGWIQKENHLDLHEKE
jgi:type IV pilus assembly protein PilP